MHVPEGYLMFTTLQHDVYVIKQDVYEEEILQYNTAKETGDDATVENFETGNTGWNFIPKNMLDVKQTT